MGTCVMPTTFPRQHYLDKGICPNCKSREVEPTFACCAVCKQTQRNWEKNHRSQRIAYSMKRYDMLKALGLCVGCALKSEGNVYCRTCTEQRSRTRAYHRALHSRNKWSKR